MDFKSLQRMAKNVIDKRGGTEALKADAEELKKIATGPGTASEKAKRAADALKDPGARATDATKDQPVTPPAETPAPPTAATPDAPPVDTPAPPVPTPDAPPVETPAADAPDPAPDATPGTEPPKP